MTNHTKQWHEERRRGIGGSDVADVLSLEPYGCARRLWYDKKGVPVDYPEPYNPHMERGRALEGVAAHEYEKATGTITIKCQAQSNKVHPWMRGNIDRVIMDADGNPIGALEIKCPARRTFMSLKSDGLPESWILQLQHYLYVYDLERGAYGILWAEGWEFIHFQVDRDEKLIFQLIEREREFWEEKVTHDRIPDKLPAGDKRCRDCRRRVTCLGLDLVVDLAVPSGPDGIGEEWEDCRGDVKLTAAVLAYVEASEIRDEALDLLYQRKVSLTELLGTDKRKLRTEHARVSHNPVTGRLDVKPYGG